MSLSERSPGKTNRRYWIEFFLWCILILAVLELFTRLFVFRVPLLVEDSAWGRVPQPGSCDLRGREGFGLTCYADNGEIDTPYHDGSSIVVLGDSFTEATQVSNADKYVSLTEVQLRERGFAVDLHNFGDSGSTLADFLYSASLLNKTYSPEIVVIQTNSVALLDTVNPSRENYFVARQGGQLELVHRELPKKDLAYENAILSSGLLTFSSFRWDRVKETVIAPRQTTEAKSASMEELKAEIRLFSAAFPNSHIVILVIPNLPIISDSKLVWNNPVDKTILDVLGGIDGLTVVYPAQAFRQLYNQDRVFARGFDNSLPNYGHLNRYGHQAVAAALTDALETLLK